MAVPWLQLLDTAIGITNAVRRSRGRAAGENQQVAISQAVPGGIEARLAGVVVAALKEAFDRDHQRLELERTHIEAERQRAERALKLEMLRQAGDREIGRMRLVAGVALASWLGTLVLASRLLGGTGGRVALGIGWLLLLLALAGAFSEQSRIARTLGQVDERTPLDAATQPGGFGLAAPWLIVAGLAAVAVGVLIS